MDTLISWISNHPAESVGIFLAICYAFWQHYLIYSAYRAALDAGRTVPMLAKVLIAPFLFMGGAMDVTLNVLLGWVAFGELPFEGYEFSWHQLNTWSLTYRCDRHLADTDWRGTLARWLCSQLLDPFQSGGHCHGCDAQ